MNDNGIIMSPLLRKHKKEIAEFFSLPCEISNIAGIAVVGSVAVATSNGCLVHPKIKSNERKVVEDTLKVPVTIGSVSFGSPFVKSGLIVNKNGAVVSDKTSGIELGYISEAFGFL
jgi:translation initiation factor 6